MKAISAINLPAGTNQAGEILRSDSPLLRVDGRHVQVAAPQRLSPHRRAGSVTKRRRRTESHAHSTGFRKSRPSSTSSRPPARSVPRTAGGCFSLKPRPAAQARAARGSTCVWLKVLPEGCERAKLSLPLTTCGSCKTLSGMPERSLV